MEQKKQDPWNKYCLFLACLAMACVVFAVWTVREISGGMWSALGGLFFDKPLYRAGELVTVGNGLKVLSRDGALLSGRLFLYGMSLLVLVVPGILAGMGRWRAWLGLALGSVLTVVLLVFGFLSLSAGEFPLEFLFALPLVQYIVLAVRTLRRAPDEMATEEQNVTVPDAGTTAQEGATADDERTKQ